MGMKPWALNETDWLKRAREAREQAENLVHPEARRLMMESRPATSEWLSIPRSVPPGEGHTRILIGWS